MFFNFFYLWFCFICVGLHFLITFDNSFKTDSSLSFTSILIKSISEFILPAPLIFSLSFTILIFFLKLKSRLTCFISFFVHNKYMN